MATRGFISVKYIDEKKEDRTLIQAVHDGYVDNMIDDIITLPFFILLSWKNRMFSDNTELPKFLNNCNYNHRHDFYRMFSEKEGSWERLKGRWSGTIPLDNTRDTFASYFISHRPDMYQVEKEPCIIYGGEIDKADIDIEFTRERLNTCTITINDYDVDDVESNEWHLKQIEEINNFLTEESVKIIVEENGKKLTMNIDEIIIDLIYHRKLK